MLFHTKIHISNLWQFSQKVVINKNENIGLTNISATWFYGCIGIYQEILVNILK